MSDNNTIIDFDEKKLKYENVFSIPIVQTRHDVSVQIYDITGKLVGTLMDEELRSGHHTIQWNASGLSSGIYFVRLQSGDFSKSQKLILLK